MDQNNMQGFMQFLSGLMEMQGAQQEQMQEAQMHPLKMQLMQSQIDENGQASPMMERYYQSQAEANEAETAQRVANFLMGMGMPPEAVRQALMPRIQAAYGVNLPDPRNKVLEKNSDPATKNLLNQLSQ